MKRTLVNDLASKGSLTMSARRNLLRVRKRNSGASGHGPGCLCKTVPTSAGVLCNASRDRYRVNPIVGVHGYEL